MQIVGLDNFLILIAKFSRNYVSLYVFFYKHLTSISFIIEIIFVLRGVEAIPR